MVFRQDELDQIQQGMDGILDIAEATMPRVAKISALGAQKFIAELENTNRFSRGEIIQLASAFLRSTSPNAGSKS